MDGRNWGGGQRRLAKLHVGEHDGQIVHRGDRETINRHVESVQAVERGRKQTAREKLAEVLRPRGAAESDLEHAWKPYGSVSGYLDQTQTAPKSADGLGGRELLASRANADANCCRIAPAEECSTGNQRVTIRKYDRVYG